MSKEAILPTHGLDTKSTTSRSSIYRNVMLSLITFALIFSLFNYESVLSTINKGMVVCKNHVHEPNVSEPTYTSLEESSPFPEAQSRSTVDRQGSFSLRRRNGDASEEGSALSTDGRSGYNRREEEDGRSGYNSVEDGRSGYNRREEEDGRSGYNSVTDGRSGYNRREEEDGRSGYNKAEIGPNGYNTVRVYKL
ncbi:hypothetical protein LY78DRAFT_686634 [Colletotrichum sublineola]|uniref:Uncharacterized protein n=1 Tax=Colletotrichum sublineola TaxID=1173701 RepID=A0A066Y025_COLSU|nr:hypothetical protein LY78DRAFT_686634 [Colletotrichum sublineola]KDN71396.1 hypothetical protein CSUB01_12569 [Colletotrichum sublineola]